MTSASLKPKPDEIECLYEITKAIHGTLDLRKALYQVLDILAERLGMNRGSISLLRWPTGYPLQQRQKDDTNWGRE
jgi:hypothetical protein